MFPQNLVAFFARTLSGPPRKKWQIAAKKLVECLDKSTVLLSFIYLHYLFPILLFTHDTVQYLLPCSVMYVVLMNKMQWEIARRHVSCVEKRGLLEQS